MPDYEPQVISTEPTIRPPVQRPTAGRGTMAERVRSLRLEKKDLFSTPHRGRSWLWLVIAALLLGGATLGYSQGWKLPTLKASLELETVPAVKERPLDILLDTTGYIAANHNVKINPRVPGMVMQLAIEEGQRVRKGDVLARLDDGQYRADLDQARAGLKAAEAALAEAKLGAREEEIAKARAALRQAEAARDLARRQMERSEKIKATIAPAEYERAASTLSQAEAAVTQAEEALKLLRRGPRAERLAALAAEVDRAKALVSKAEYFVDATQIRAPLDGTVLQKSVELGEMVRADTMATTSFCTLADLSQLEAEIDIQERDLAGIRVGQPCLVTPEAYPDHEYAGRLSWLSPMYNRQRGVRKVKIQIEKPDELLAPDMNCRVQVLRSGPLPGSATLVKLPVEAVRGEGNTQCVWLYEDGVARRREVRLGATSDGKVEIREGLKGGETVLLPGAASLADGQDVRLKAKAPAAKGVKLKERSAP